MPTDINIDGLDKKILTLLIKNIRISYVEIARQCNVTGSAIHQRMQKLIDNNIIDAATFLPNPKALGYFTLAFVGVQINLIGKRTHIEVFEFIKSIEEVTECHDITGKYSFLLKVYAHNNEHLKHLLVEKIQSLEEVSATETLISLEEGFTRNLPIK